MSSFYLPKDLLINVLSRLPPKKLACCKCLSKSWCNLIESREKFGKKYLNQLTDSDSGSKFVYTKYDADAYDGAGGFGIYMSDCSTNEVRQLFCPKSRDLHYELIGSANGVLCLLYKDTDIVLWNPLSHNFHEVSIPGFYLPSREPHKYIIYGFGYDKSTDDYKVLVFVLCSSNSWLYGLKLKEWKIVENIRKFRPDIFSHGIFVSGAIHWVVSDSSMLLAFDLADERFKTMSKPEYSDDNYNSDRNVANLGGCVSLTRRSGSLTFTDNDGIEVPLELWVMNDYGVKDSWSQMIKLRVPCVSPFIEVQPITHLKSNEQLVLDSGAHILLFDIKDQTFQRIVEHDMRRRCNRLSNSQLAFAFLETLELSIM